MIKVALLIFYLLITIPDLLAQKVTLDKARQLYFSMSEDKCAALKLTELFEKSEPTDNMLKAYNGAALAAAPACVGNPARKISMFRKGTKLLDEAVKNEPENFEAVFLRFATQDKAPGFLGYNDHINSDKNFLLKNLQRGKELVSDDKVFNEIVNFLLKSEKLNQNEKKLVNTFSNKHLNK